MIAADLKPRGPYSLRISGRLASDATRVVVHGSYHAAIAIDGRLESVRAWQRTDGVVCVRAESEAGLEHVRYALGLGARRGASLVRLCRTLELERLKDVPTDAAAHRLERERGLGPWSVGVVCLQGLGRYERGLARDLGLVKLAAELWGRRVEAEETDELLAPYEEWAGLASVYLLAGYHAGVVGA